MSFGCAQRFDSFAHEKTHKYSQTPSRLFHLFPHHTFCPPLALHIPTKRVDSALCKYLAGYLSNHSTCDAWSDSLRRITRPPLIDEKSPASLSYSLAHGDFFGHGHDVNLPGSAPCAEIANQRGCFEYITGPRKTRSEDSLPR